jgi:hypothetical protein
MHLSVSKDQTITVVGSRGEAKQIAIPEATGKQRVFDWFGGVHEIEVQPAPHKERLALAACASGETMVLGETHSILQRDIKEGTWKRSSLTEIDGPVMVMLPQRKLESSPKLFDAFMLDEKGLYLEPAQATDMLDLMRKASWCGITTMRRKAELRIDLERNRPSCFASKLINGALQYELEKTLSGLIGGGIVSPKRLFDKAYLDEVKEKGILMEGASVFHNTPFLPPRFLEKDGDVYHIHLDDQMTPVETTWCHF